MIILAVLLTTLHLLIWGTLLSSLRYLRRQPCPKPTADVWPSLSVLIPARNEARNLQRLLPTLLRQDYPHFEVIVYDDGSEDATPFVLQRYRADPHLRVLRGKELPPGWVGKVHALYQATRHARGSLYLFLDADAELLRPDALRHLVARYRALPPGSVATALPSLRGGGQLLVSLVPLLILGGLPWSLVRRVPHPLLGALNGQCWLMDATRYHRLEPHRHHRAEVLEDVQIGRYLKRHGLIPELLDLRRELAVHMYPDLKAAWQGFRKNAYLLMGGRSLYFLLLWLGYGLTFVLAPLIWWPLLLSIYGLKLITDRLQGYPLWLSLLAPLSYFLAWILQGDSAWNYGRGRLHWKGRRIKQPTRPAPSP
ncbi:glycosyltransferase [Rhodothermus profundi]|uniref:glycosyltransferase n=1 Tax=Rhodothermus profundi TaxID=633813 RepID=UPI000932178C|nr:glycosyltransferase [Rhodothermus profundi]